jgi:pimeloyl-ACP methyl ester carboxylesterase
MGSAHASLPGPAYVELVSFRSPSSGQVLDGALWWPDQDPVGAVVYLHGKGGNFYSGPSRWLPERCRHLPIVHLGVNMSCHDLGYTRVDVPAPDFAVEDVPVAGGMWEDISAGPGDVAGAVALLRGRGVDQVAVAGHSSGGFYVGRYSAAAPDVAARVLLSPLLTNRTALSAWFDGPGLDQALQAARALVAAGGGGQLVSVPRWYYGISAASLLQRAADPPGAWEQGMAASSAPTLWVWGDAESRHRVWSAAFAAQQVERKEKLVVAGAEHHYLGHERLIADRVGAFLMSVFGSPGRAD